MPTINEVKQNPEADSPLLFFQCTLSSGDVYHWSTHTVMFGGASYSARVLRHNLFDLQLSGDDAMDGVSQVSLTLANADSFLSELNREIGLKGAQLVIYFAFADLPSGTITTESTTLFRGVAGDPDEITEEWLRITFANKLSLQRIPLPEVRIQRSCPWNFPASLDQRSEALFGGAKGRYSRYFRCGYSADVQGGVGNLNNGQAYSSCDGSRLQCQQRGMFTSDSRGSQTSRYGGFEFVPSAVLVRTAGAKSSQISALTENSAKYNDPVPLVYGTGWLKAPVDFARNDGNLTHLEVIAGLGPIQGVLKVVVNDVEIPLAVAGQDMRTTGWYSIVTVGQRNGNFNYDFTDAKGNPLGDPYGSIAVLQIAVPNRISSGSGLPDVEVLLQGVLLDIYDGNGQLLNTTYSNNPAWVILDILRRSGWSPSELSLGSFALAAAFCASLIQTTDANGNLLQVPRFECNLLLVKRQSAATVIRGIRVAASLMLRLGTTGLLELVPEAALAVQQPAMPDGSNSMEPLNDGWPAYEFSDSSATFSGIVRLPDGSSSVRLTSRTVAETSNRLSVEFQDAFNEYQQDSLSVVDSGDSDLIGYEVSSQSTAMGIANMSQATRVLLRQLDKSTKGNLFVQFQTSFRALKVRPGDIIAFTYAKEGLYRAPFRVVKLSPSLNYELVTILGQAHDDAWYTDNPAVLAGAGRQPLSSIQTPRPLLGLLPHLDPKGRFENFDFEIDEMLKSQTDGSATDTLTVSFAVPSKPEAGSPNLPLLSLAPTFHSKGGTLPSATTFYYAVSAVDEAGREGALSFTVPSAIPGSTDTNCVTLTELSFPSIATSFHVYRGNTPQTLYRIASSVTIAATFTDTGLPYVAQGPPDASFDHANFYYRREYAGPFYITSASSSTVSAADMGAVPSAYIGRSVRITEGTGRGQERTVLANDGTTLTVSPIWSTVPDVSSQFTIVDGSWKFAAVSATSPVQFEIAYQPGMVIQVTGRGANVSNIESVADLCPVARKALGDGKPDSGTTPAPDFTLTAPGAGLLNLMQVGFDDLTNVASVTSGTLELFCWNELSNPLAYTLATAVDQAAAVVSVGANAPGYVGQLIQVDSELMLILSVDTGTGIYGVARAALSSAAMAHPAGASVLHLDPSTSVVPFALQFFENRAATNFIHTIAVPDKRICASQFFVTNAFGDSQAKQQCYTTGPGGGLRTLSGGQFSLQVSGMLATQQNAAPSLLVEASHAIRDLRASLQQPASGYDIGLTLMMNGIPLCKLLIPSGATVSSVVDGVTLAPLSESASLSLNVTLNVLPNYTGSLSPGRDLTLTIRL